MLRKIIFGVFALLSVVLISYLLFSCSASSHPQHDEIMRIVRGKSGVDTSYIYDLPFEKGKRYRMVQGYFGMFTHRNRAALDFNMPKGSKVAAAREGVVVRVKSDGTKGGFNKKYRSEGNLIVIEHSDGSRAGYWHLSPNSNTVMEGDTVQKGQIIALSGKTGYAATPHLHFIVWKRNNGDWIQVPTRFQTSKGVKYLRNLKRYTH